MPAGDYQKNIHCGVGHLGIRSDIIDQGSDKEQTDVSATNMRRVAASMTVAVILVLSTLFYFVFFYPLEESHLTLTEFVEKAKDTNGDGVPDDYFPYADGDSVIVRDIIVGARFGSFVVNESYTFEWWHLTFSYDGKKWRDYYHGQITVNLVNVSLCSYGLGGWIMLRGEIREYSMGGIPWASVEWTPAEEDAPVTEPQVELNITQVSPKKWGIVVSGCDNNCKLMHYEFVLRKYGFGWDWMEPPEHGKTTMLMEFWDMDRDGYLSTGDKVYVEVEDEGDYSFEVFFHDQEMASVSFTCEDP